MMLEEPALRPTDRLLLGPSAHHLVDFAMPRIVAAVAEPRAVLTTVRQSVVT